MLTGPKSVESVSDCWTAIGAGYTPQLPPNTGVNKLPISQITKHWASEQNESISGLLEGHSHVSVASGSKATDSIPQHDSGLEVVGCCSKPPN